MESSWKNTSVRLANLEEKSLGQSNILMFMKKREEYTYTITTEHGKEIKVSGDHPIFTPKGMKLAKNLGENDHVVTYPFIGIPYEKPSEEIILDIRNVEQYVDSLGITDKGNAKKQIINHIKQMNILPLRYSSSQLPVFIKIMGHIFGDGVLTFVNKKKGYVHFYGTEDDLQDIKRDLASIGIKTQRICKRLRHHRMRTQYGLVEFDFEEKSIIKKSTGFAVLLALLGTPHGKKQHISYRIPEWLKKATKWQKRLFLASFFGAELSTPATSNKYNFYCPELNMNKSEKLLENGITFLQDIANLLREFGVETNAPVFVPGNDYDGVYGKTMGLRLLIYGNLDNLLKLYGNIGYEYCRQKQKLACVAIDYLHAKQNILAAKEEIIGANGMVLKRRVGKNFISFEDFVREQAFGNSGLTVDTIAQIKKEQYNDYVYDFTVNHKDHNFIANSMVVSNCGMRLMTTNLTFKEVQPQLRKLTDHLFKTVPAGVGCKGFLDVNNQQFDDIATDGVKWCVENGYGWKDDLTNAEGYGKIHNADISKVSQRARSRGINQLGTLGSGNHYLEIQHVKKENIFDEEIAKKFGIFEDQIVIMVHCGSRGFGHQIATDYLKTFDDAMVKYGINVYDRELACAPFSSTEGQNYFKAMACAANMAFANRQMITHRIREGFSKLFGKTAEEMEMKLVYDVAHNIAKVEKHKIDGKLKEVVMHRKGSTRAFPPGHEELNQIYKKTGQPVILGGSMETGSYLLVGTQKAMDETFGSTAHGSGRVMSRSQAKREFRGDELQKQMEKKGIYVRTVSMSGLAEEAGDAYKDINNVVDVLHNYGITKKVVGLKPIANIKG